MAFLDKVKDLLSKNSSKVDMAIDKVGDAVDKKTGNKYRGVVDKAQDAAKKAAAGTGTQQPGQSPQATNPPAATPTTQATPPPANTPPTAPPVS